jgi:hypothetical protein
VHRSKEPLYSITSSSRASGVGGTVRPSAFAVLRLMTSSNLVGCSIGRSAGNLLCNALSVVVESWRSRNEDRLNLVRHQPCEGCVDITGFTDLVDAIIEV